MNTQRAAASVVAQMMPALAVYTAMQEYRNPVLVNKMMAELNLTRPAAEQLFEDVKRFLSLAHSSSRHAPPKQVDEGWHLFILFTEDYAAFCREYIGHFVHHVPEDPFRKMTLEDYETVSRTCRFAEAVYGELSDNWKSTGAKTSDMKPAPV